jgi:hypothetical protein
MKDFEIKNSADRNENMAALIWGYLLMLFCLPIGILYVLFGEYLTKKNRKFLFIFYGIMYIAAYIFTICTPHR